MKFSIYLNRRVFVMQKKESSDRTVLKHKLTFGSSFSLFIFYPYFSAIKPNFYKNPLFEKTVAAQGGNITIPCRPEAAPTPDITWTRNGQQIGLDGRYSVSIDGTLHVTQVNFVDQGQYVCKANNVYGESQSATSVLVYGELKSIVNTK